MDPVYGYQAVNVEAQINSTTSLLHWNRRMIEIRKRHPAFGSASSTSSVGQPGGAGLRPVDAQVNEDAGDTVLCVNNMSRFPQPVELDLSAWRGGTLHELTGGVPFPRIGDLPYLLTLPGHGFYWFAVHHPAEENP